MRLIHTSDWHLGQSLHNFDRSDGHRAFGGWLIGSLVRGLLAIAQIKTRRTQASAILKQRQAQGAKSKLWGTINRLIGAADGKKFCNYAQQYTLDVLIGYANRHLHELARRYRLQRSNDSLALMVIDQDMGDEARSVHSLSGGESFLVSLALVLGLATLSSKRRRVESLFVVEGFGSLTRVCCAWRWIGWMGCKRWGARLGEFRMCRR